MIKTKNYTIYKAEEKRFERIAELLPDEITKHGSFSSAIACQGLTFSEDVARFREWYLSRPHPDHDQATCRALKCLAIRNRMYCEYCLTTGFMRVRQPRGGDRFEPCVWCDSHRSPPSINPTKSVPVALDCDRDDCTHASHTVEVQAHPSKVTPEK